MQRAVISCSSNGANKIVSGVTGRRIRVICFLLSFSGSVNAKWQDGTTDVTGLIYGAAAATVASPQDPMLPGGPYGQFETSQGVDLNLNLSSAVAVGGYIVYDLVP